MPNGRGGWIRKAEQKDKLVADVLAQLRDGGLQPGDRLLSFKELCQAYNASQHAVRKALDELDARGIILRKPRSGYYVREEAPRALHPAAPAAPEALTDDPADALYPHTGEDVLTIYISDGLPQKMRLWQEALAAFARRQGGGLRLRTFCCEDGHLQEIIRREELDLVQAPPQVLESIGGEAFLPVEELEPSGLRAEMLVEPVRRYLEITGRPLAGVPFSLTLPYLYVNLDLAERLALERLDRRDPLAFARQVLEAARRRPEVPCKPFVWATLSSMLLEAGALLPRGDGGVDLRDDRAAEVLAVMAENRDRGGALAARFGAYLRGNILAWRHHSFTRLSLLEACPFRWQTLAPPLHPEGTLAPMLCMLAIRSGTRHLQTCLDLVQFLSSEESHRRFARSGGNIPVRADAVFAAESVAAQPFDRDDLEAYLHRCDLTWNALRRNLPLAADLRQLSSRFEQGGLSATEALDRLRFIYQRYRLAHREEAHA